MIKIDKMDKCEESKNVIRGKKAHTRSVPAVGFELAVSVQRKIGLGCWSIVEPQMSQIRQRGSHQQELAASTAVVVQGSGLRMTQTLNLRY